MTAVAERRFLGRISSPDELCALIEMHELDNDQVEMSDDYSTMIYRCKRNFDGFENSSNLLCGFKLIAVQGESVGGSSNDESAFNVYLQGEHQHNGMGGSGGNGK